MPKVDDWDNHPTTIHSNGEIFHLTAVQIFWEAYGCSWRGNTTKRDGKSICCGHKHKTQAAADKCRDKMRRDRPGKCQDYRTRELHMFRYSKKV